MSLITVPMYRIVCDAESCEESPQSEEYYAWLQPEGAEEDVRNAYDWYTEGEKHLCPEHAPTRCDSCDGFDGVTYQEEFGANLCARCFARENEGRGSQPAGSSPVEKEAFTVTPNRALREALGWAWRGEPGVPSATECVKGVLDDLRERGYVLIRVVDLESAHNLCDRHCLPSPLRDRKPSSPPMEQI